MKHHRPGSLALCLLLFLLLTVPLLATSSEDETWLRVLPASGTPAVGQEIDVEVWAEDAANLYAAEVRLSFDTARLEVVNAQITPRSDLLAPDLVMRKSADNEAGTIWYATTQLNPREPVTGSGAIFSFKFLVLFPGEALVKVEECILSDRDANVLPASAAGAAYQIGTPHQLFLPLIAANN